MCYPNEAAAMEFGKPCQPQGQKQITQAETLNIRRATYLNSGQSFVRKSSYSHHAVQVEFGAVALTSAGSVA
jgi:hypothetical protein